MVSHHDENVSILQQEAISTYSKFPGIQLKSLVYVDNLGYRYYKNKSRNNKITEFCPTTAIICADMNENWKWTNLNHNHNPPIVNIPMVHLRRSIGMAGIKTQMMKEIIHLSNLKYLSVKIMRQSRRPPNPDTIEELAVILNNTAYASTLQQPPQDSFINNYLKLREKLLGWYFLVLMPLKTFPMVYALTSKITQATYESLFQIVYNYERESNLQRCWFHYCQNIPEAHRVLRMVMALPHLLAEIQPECQFAMLEGFNAIIEYANGIEEISERLQVKSVLDHHSSATAVTGVEIDGLMIYTRRITTE
ncbi:MULE domain-containing protein [Aphis craccivora]|uniref:MULE domain-containing protein n=1 Tax=Aphis craccivora TaxID=307492 RepID=A0A6G0Z2H3_APHCR|nr:MULE domain-containing protein [Aphis craccivora]